MLRTGWVVVRRTTRTSSSSSSIARVVSETTTVTVWCLVIVISGRDRDHGDLWGTDQGRRQPQLEHRAIFERNGLEPLRGHDRQLVVQALVRATQAAWTKSEPGGPERNEVKISPDSPRYPCGAEPATRP